MENWKTYTFGPIGVGRAIPCKDGEFVTVADAQATVEALQRERDQWKEAFERSCDDTAHLKAALDAEREKVKAQTKLAIDLLTSRSCQRHQDAAKQVSFQYFYQQQKAQGCDQCAWEQLTQLQALVRALPVVNGKLEVDSGACYYVRALDGKENPVVCGLMTEQATAFAIKALLAYRATLPATPPAVCPDCDGEGVVDSGGTAPNGNPLMRRCGCREKGGDGE